MSTGVDDRYALHAAALSLELDWLEAVLNLRLEQHFQQQAQGFDAAPPPPSLPPGSALAQLIDEQGLLAAERAVLALALAPHLRPGVLDLLFVRNQNLDRGFTEFGGWKAQRHGGFLPTGETAAFLVAGDDLARRIALFDLFDPQRPFMARDILRLDCEGASNEPQLSGALSVSAETLQRLQTGVWHKPDYNIQFPAKRITTDLDWSDLVLTADVFDEISVIQTWMHRGPELMRDWGLGRAVKPGYRSLFYGPPGTGKTLTATLLGQSAGVDVYRIDLSMVVSKYIGETEKNLARVFDQAQSRHWVLFFDEADALFGKRSAVQNSNDRHANQEIAYLLQRVEDFPGVVILASNLRGNIDEAFSRRFQSMVYFPMPDADQRLRLWRGLLPQNGRLAPDVDLEAIAEQHVLSGGAIVNVLRFAVLQAARSGTAQVGAAHLRMALAKELSKEGRTVA
ncbi:ATP-binding protein [Dyella choica]|uniref:ATP-binding protein n=1 Tax=Dyella choica TaxID=1927959 RepID=A0A432MAS8_9GAMM|nr:ATP-binding protein [Dyella choica]RUL79018.1 ATP-binding protein [Dyella choica]